MNRFFRVLLLIAFFLSAAYADEGESHDNYPTDLNSLVSHISYFGEARAAMIQKEGSSMMRWAVVPPLALAGLLLGYCGFIYYSKWKQR